LMPGLPTEPSGRLASTATLRVSPEEEGRSNKTSRPAFFLFLHLIRSVLLVAGFGRQPPEIAYQFNSSPRLPYKSISQVLFPPDLGPQYSPAAMPIPFPALLFRSHPRMLKRGGPATLSSLVELLRFRLGWADNRALRVLEKLGGGEMGIIYKAASSSPSTKEVAACSSAIR